jgi:hypothetical protein
VRTSGSKSASTIAKARSLFISDYNPPLII